ncbi:hypothetical protein HDV62DRAFT_366157 [Trichoderma sp. SZMC 28011]
MGLHPCRHLMHPAWGTCTWALLLICTFRLVCLHVFIGTVLYLTCPPGCLPTKVLGVFFVGAVVQWRLPCLVDATLSGHQI